MQRSANNLDDIVSSESCKELTVSSIISEMSNLREYYDDGEALKIVTEKYPLFYAELAIYCYKMLESSLKKFDNTDNSVLEKLGYNGNDRATSILSDLILEVICLKEQKSDEEVVNIVNNKNSFLYIDLACFDLEIGLNKLRSELSRIHSTRNLENIDVEVYSEIFGDNLTPTIEDTILSVSEYIVNKRKNNMFESIKEKIVV